MDINFIKKALAGELSWFALREYTEEDFRKGIQHSVQVMEDEDVSKRILEELIELSHSVLKLDREPHNEDERLHLHEEVGDALWAIGCLIEKYHLSESTIKYIRKLKDEREFHENKEG